LENAYRDVRIAFSAEVVRDCDRRDIDFYALREDVNTELAQVDDASDDPNAVPSGGLLIPTIGVGGHCLPKDGILLWWRRIESGADTSRSLILAARRINDASPAATIPLYDGVIDGKTVALLGTAYRFNSEDTRNSPTLALARLLLDRGCTVRLHDPYVKPDDQNLEKFGLTAHFTNDVDVALQGADIVIMCTGHRDYLGILDRLRQLRVAVVDGCNLYHSSDFADSAVAYTGIGRGCAAPTADLVAEVVAGFRSMEQALAREVAETVDFLNDAYASDAHNRVSFSEVRRLAATCVTGCSIPDVVLPQATPAAVHGPWQLASLR
ncbi:MAG TPA: UDP binding domain-containing protein, partial [Gemmatimonadaceae bacterium]|nr:UDP binding domain-containing protein [Gemmatimonadaceae bacterium]